MFVWPVHVDATPARPGGKFSEKADGELRLEIATVNPPGTDGWRKEFEADACGEREGSGRPEEHAELKPWVARYQADETDCLRDLDWPDIQIQSLNDEIIAENVKKEYRTRGPIERREPLNQEVSDD